MKFVTYSMLFISGIAAQGHQCPAEIGCGDACGLDKCVVYDAETCGCLPEDGATCPTEPGPDGLTIDKEDCNDCDGSCLVSTHSFNDGDDGRGLIQCECVVDSDSSVATPVDSSSSYQPPDNTCERAYDDNDYCKCPPPRPYPEDPEQQEISVCGDATYLIPADAQACAGPVDKDPAGTVCPKKGDETTIACRPEILSYLTGGSTGTCVAPEDATCVKLNTGAWGCVFPGNCNTVNTCTKQPACTDEYETNEDGTCKVADNGYPIPGENHTGYDTTELTKLKADPDADSGRASAIFTGVIAIGVAMLATAWH